MVFNSNNYDDYSRRVKLLRSFGDYLLQRIKLLESDLNKRKQQNQQVDESKIKELHDLITTLLQSLAEINVCQFFFSINEYYYHHSYYYKTMCWRYFKDLMLRFNLNLNEIKKGYNNNNNKQDDDIDFSIS